jgi:hypothetical protein
VKMPKGWVILLGLGLGGGVDQAAAVTFAGRFSVPTLDGSLAEWSAGDRLYVDSEIGDGTPLNSSYSDVYMVNDATYLYVGLKLKAASSIFSNWTHSLYLDTDLNPATGYNAGWMSGGYDVLVQYGAGGGSYSIFSFTGGGSQWNWSWNFVDVIGYAFNNDVIEWAIPRAQLGGSAEARVQFLTAGGDADGNPTWANSFESGAKSYAMAATPTYTVTVVSARGTASPGAGSHVYSHGTVVTPSVIQPAAANGTQYVSLGWAMTGHSPVSGGDTNFSLTVTNNATLTWLWQTNVQLTRTVSGNGTLSGDGDGYYARGATVNLTATPDAGYVFRGWSGDVPSGQTNDNPLALSMDRKRNVTANFGPYGGPFAAKTLDGSLSDWSSAELFYSDGEIADGAPLNSTYSAVYVANDQTYLYVGLQLKASSDIFSNWLHSIYMDTDLNGGTGFNAGWMSGGYDRMVQYGGGGGAYSIYGFTGGSQGDWSWNFLDVIGYAYNNNVIEWAIPRSALGGSTQAKLEFYVGGGSVTIETWAHQTEALARIYGMAATPTYTVTVVSARGTASPAAGSHTYNHGTAVTPSVIQPAAANGTQYVSLGWAMTGHSPVSGGDTNFSMTVTNNATLTWLWQTNVQLTRTVSGNGTLSGDGDGYYARGTTVNLTATPDAGYVFRGWSGDVPTGQTNDNPLALSMDRKRNVTANYTVFTGRFSPITLDGSLAEWLTRDVFYTDAEIGDGVPLNSTYSSVSVANDQTYLYVGLQLKASSDIFSNWLHTLYIDSDLNPATGWDAGWMSGGYDRMVQYGGGGGTYSIYAFTGGSQGDWSWNLVDVIGYAYNNDVIEWAIPRSALGGSTQARLEFYVGGGSVAVETWAHQTEAQSRIYSFGSTPTYTVTVASARGTASPAAGSHVYSHGTVVTPSVIQPAAANGTQYVSLGWAMTGHSPVSGGDTNFSMTVTNNATLTWLWQTNVQLTRAVSGNGTLSGDGDGYYARGTTVNLTATPDAGYVFRGWSGDVPTGQTNDNPLALSMDRKRNVTANFGPYGGPFAAKTLDGSLSDWSSAELFYSDGEIADGAPLNSTYSAVYVANDQTYLYVGLQLKASSDIFSNWLHSIYMDTDLNGGTGFNAGWMSGGYDRMVQYGGGGGAYSIYAFTGGSQGDWSWNFLDVIGYAYNNNVIEWAIPRSALGGSTQAKLEFYVGGGSVTVETWAHQTEALARIYGMAATPTYTVTVVSARGTASPAAGSHTYNHGTAVTPSVIQPAAANGTQYVSLGWAMTGHSPVSGGDTNFSLTVTNNATLTWLWQTNVQFTRTVGSGGGVTGDTNGYYILGSAVTVTATEASGFTFTGWAGGVPSGQESDNPLVLNLDQARSISAVFQRSLGRYASPTLDGSLAEWQAQDVFYDDPEISEGSPLNSTYASVRVVNDSTFLYVGLQMKDNSGILSNWTHNLYLDTDLNPATGFNSGWMSGGYDVLIQYGTGGGNYSAFTFVGGNQAAWSWNFADVIGYAFNGSVAEWAIPRSVLNGATEVRLQFLTDGGGVTETWAPYAEALAQTYAFATPDGCVPGYNPLVASLSDKTVDAGSTLNFTVSASDPGCVAPILVVTGKPSAASFLTSVSTTNRVGTFSWTPGGGDVGTYVLRFIATDDESRTHYRTIRIYVGNSGEPRDGNNVPNSQTNWSVVVEEIPPSGANGDLTWTATPGIVYDVYYSDSDPAGNMSWQYQGQVTADASAESLTVPESARRYYKVVPAGESPNKIGLWGVIKPTVPSGFSMQSAPLDLADRSMGGELGNALKAVLSNGDRVYAMEANGSFTTITLAGGAWDTAYTFAEGQGFFVQSASGATPRFAGPVGNDGSANRTINGAANGRWNILGLSQGKTLSFSSAFATGSFTGTPTGDWDETVSDLVVIDQGNGNWKRIMRTGSSTWLDLDTFSTPSVSLTPGSAVYYFHYGNSALSINF